MDVSHFPKFIRDRIKDKGLGDLVKESIELLTMGGVTPCGSCKKRQEVLNDLLRFKAEIRKNDDEEE
tara:strand:- start:524 stop:724 length:201 start_codon:yes stop_codon:yes gene_type:complete